jgi:microcystin-dependent protein
MPFSLLSVATQAIGSYLYIDDAQAVPSNYVECNGQAISRISFAAYFALVGTKYGVGDGSTTFNVPDFRGRYSLGRGQGTGLTNRVSGTGGGEETHILALAELTAHAHVQTRFSITPVSGVNLATDTNTGTQVNAVTNTSTQGSGTGHNTMAPFLCGGMFCVKVQ